MLFFWFLLGILQKSSKNRNIQKEFIQWLEKCHSQFDKQVKFLGYVKTVKRPDVSIKKSQYPWAVFSTIELDGKIYKAGDLVSVPILIFNCTYFSEDIQIDIHNIQTFFSLSDAISNTCSTIGELGLSKLFFFP